MTVKQMAEALSLDVVCMPDGDREVTGGYAGDLLSWVMGRANAGDAWITIMSNVNVVAVASLADVACVIFSEDVMPDADAVVKAQKEGINLLSVSLGSYETAAKLSELL